MAQPFLHDGQHGFAGFGKHDPISFQPGGGKAWREQIRLLQDPQHRSVQTRQDAGDEQGRGGGMFGIRSSGGGFVQRIQAQAAAGQHLVDNGYPKRYEFRNGASGNGASGMGMFKAANALSQITQHGGRGFGACRIRVGGSALDGSRLNGSGS